MRKGLLDPCGYGSKKEEDRPDLRPVDFAWYVEQAKKVLREFLEDDKKK
ncbi:MAG: hypothetical protein WC745_01975 [Patescibacteria group bacterium]|jgi:hypothetical protein